MFLLIQKHLQKALLYQFHYFVDKKTQKIIFKFLQMKKTNTEVK